MLHVDADGCFVVVGQVGRSGAMACIFMTCIVIAYIVLAYIVMAYSVMALLLWVGLQVWRNVFMRSRTHRTQLSTSSQRAVTSSPYTPTLDPTIDITTPTPTDDTTTVILDACM